MTNRESCLDVTLRHAGSEVTSSTTGAEALELAKVSEPHLVVLDLVIPE